MKKRTQLLAAVSMLMGMSACNNNSEEIAPANTLPEIRISASIGEQTRLADNKFQAGDQIMVYGWMGDAATIPDTPPIASVNTLKSTETLVDAWVPEPKMLLQHPTNLHSFLGFYPVRKVSNFTADPYTVDVNNQVASDLMVASGSTNRPSSGIEDMKEDLQTIDLKFVHVMAKFQLNLKFGDEITDRTVYAVRLFCVKEATLDYKNLNTLENSTYYKVPTVNVAQDATASFISLPELTTAAEGYAASYASIVIPQTGVTRIEVDVNGKTYAYTHTEDIPLEQNKITTLNLTVGRTAVNPQLISASVKNWDTNTTINAETFAEEDETKPTLFSTAAGTIAKNSSLIDQYLHEIGTLRVAGPLNEDDLEAIGTFGQDNDNLVTLDLSRVTGVTAIPENMFIATIPGTGYYNTPYK